MVCVVRTTGEARSAEALAVALVLHIPDGGGGGGESGEKHAAAYYYYFYNTRVGTMIYLYSTIIITATALFLLL